MNHGPTSCRARDAAHPGLLHHALKANIRLCTPWGDCPSHAAPDLRPAGEIRYYNNAAGTQAQLALPASVTALAQMAGWAWLTIASFQGCSLCWEIVMSLLACRPSEMREARDDARKACQIAYCDRQQCQASFGPLWRSHSTRDT